MNTGECHWWRREKARPDQSPSQRCSPHQQPTSRKWDEQLVFSNAESTTRAAIHAKMTQGPDKVFFIACDIQNGCGAARSA